MIDLDRKYIFTHPPKCAGASVEKSLGLWGPERDRTMDDMYRNLLHKSLDEHMKHVPEDMNIDDIFKFTVVRNPWNRAVSRYYHNCTHNKLFIKMVLTFEEYIHKCYETYQQTGECNDHTVKEFVCYNGSYMIDHVIRQENFEYGLHIAMETLNIEDYYVYHTDQNTIRPDTDDYRAFYNSDTKQMVAEMAHDMIEIFDYSF